MPMDHETTTDELDALLTTDGTIDARSVRGNPTGRVGRKVSRNLCERWTTAVESGERTVWEIAREHGDISRAGVWYHVDGDCSHAEDQP